MNQLKSMKEAALASKGKGNLGIRASGNGTKKVEPRPAGSVKPAEKCGRANTAKSKTPKPSGSAKPAKKHGRGSPDEQRARQPRY